MATQQVKRLVVYTFLINRITDINRHPHYQTYFFNYLNDIKSSATSGAVVDNFVATTIFTDDHIHNLCMDNGLVDKIYEDFVESSIIILEGLLGGLLGGGGGGLF